MPGARLIGRGRPQLRPYLGAVTLLASTGLPTGAQVLALGGYCLLMVNDAATAIGLL